MEREDIIKLGRESIILMLKDLANMHGIIVDKNIPNDDADYKWGLKIIESQKIAEENRIKEEEKDRQYLESLDTEFRQYILLHRKYNNDYLSGGA